MAIRLTGEFYDLNGREHRVDIYDNDFSGSASDIDVKYCRISYDSQNNDDPCSPMIGSRAEIGMKVDFEDTVLPTFIEDFSNGQEDRFFVEVYNVGSSRVIWRGIMTPDFAGETDTAPLYEFKVAAVCGLATLKKIPYHDGTAIYEGVERLLKHLTTALGKIIHTDVFWDASAVFIKTAVDCWEASMSSGATDDAMYQAAVDHSAFYDFKTSGNVDKDVLSAYEVIESILTTLKCRILQNEGVWWVEQIPYRTASPYYSRHYSKSGTYISNATESGAIVLNQTKTGAKLATMSYDFLPALKRADITYKVKMRRNFIAGVSDNNPNFNQEISTNGGTAIMRLRFTLNYHVQDNGLGAPAGAVYFIIPKVVLKIGANYLDRNYTIQNFTAILDPIEWTTSIGGAIHIPIQVGQIVPGTDGVKGSITVELLTPPLPAAGSANEFAWSTDECDVKKFNGTLMAENLFLKDLHVVDQYLEIFDQGTPFVTEDQTLYTATNDNGASERYEKDLILGTAGFANSVGRLKVWNGSEWVNAGFWGQGVAPRNFAIGALLSLHIINQRDKPLRRLNGSILGNFRMHHLLQDPQDRMWMMSSCSWDIGNNTMQGTWFQLIYGADGIASSPVKIKVNPPNSPPTVDPTGPGLGVTNYQPGFYSNPPPTVLKPISYNAIDAKIDAGDVITSIALNVASLGNEFAPDDAVRIVHPVTGVYQEFEIDTPPALGDTTLSVVSEAALYDFPEGAYLVVQQRPYAFTLPEANQGEILRFNATSEQWEAYAGAADGHVLTWDPTNGWQSEVNPAGVLGYNKIRDNGTLETQRESMQFLNTGRISWAITDDAVDAETDITADIVANSIGNTYIRKGAALSVIGVTGNALADVADIVGAADQVLRVNSAGNALAFGQVATGGIADDAVTYAKIQNVVNNNRVLGRVSGANGIVEELTAGQMQTMLGYIDGALVATRIPYASDANTLTDSANMRWLNGTREIIIGDGVSKNARFTHNEGAPIAGDNNIVLGENNVSGNYAISIINTRNAANQGGAKLLLQVGGSSASDAFIEYNVSGASNTWTEGVDNSDADKFKITPKSTAPGSVANSGIIITSAAIALVGINKDAPAHPLDVAGRVRAVQLINTDNEPTVGTLGNGLGTGPTIDDVTGTNNGFTISFTTGTGPANNGDLFTVTYHTAFPAFSIPVFCQVNNHAANEFSKFIRTTTTGGSFTMKANGTLTATTQYVLAFVVTGF